MRREKNKVKKQQNTLIELQTLIDFTLRIDCGNAIMIFKKLIVRENMQLNTNYNTHNLLITDAFVL